MAYRSLWARARGSFLGDTTIRLLGLATWVPVVISFNDHVATITSISGGSMYPYYNEDRNRTLANDMVLTWRWNPMDGLQKGMIITFSYFAPADNNAQTTKEGFSFSSPAAAASFEEDRYAGQTGGLLPDIRINRQSFGQDMSSQEDDSFEEEGRPPYLHAMIAGGLGGSTGDMLMHSLDTVKTRQQGDPHIPPKYTSLGSSYYTIWRQEGIRRGLYGGWVPALSGSLPGTMLFFGTYEWSKRFLIEHGLQHHLSYLTAGFLGDLAGSIVYVPSEVLKTRMQLQGRYNNPYFKSGYNYRGTVDAARTIVRHEGLPALFHGYQATLYRDLPFSALQFMFWEQFHAWARTYKQSRDVGVPLELLTGGLAGSLAGVMTCPLDVVKTRLQTQVHPDLLPKESKPAVKSAAHASASKSQTRNISTSSPSTHTPRPGAVNLQTSSVIQGLKVIYQTEGLSGWFRGVGPRGVWTFIQSGTMLFLYQRILKQLEIWDPPVEEQKEHAI
ncbi:mitochondrial carrier protein [Colletotrichum incanum]|uniref:Mitochondrial carrier protein n=1 Tax=Colletotrichum incanum TaxID=1573173 RepID=A0A167CU76_COLIC|nr:mitochondrial carrier protein [Colletotrichum incanum]